MNMCKDHFISLTSESLPDNALFDNEKRHYMYDNKARNSMLLPKSDKRN